MNGINVTRDAGARFWLPSQDEWYKAAYHDASAGLSGAYFDYATGSDTMPISDQPGDSPDGANYFNDDGLPNGFNDGYAATGSTSFRPNPLTDVGAYFLAPSPYGTYDQTGNVAEWTETVFSLSPPYRLAPGGNWFGSQGSLLAAMPNIGGPAGSSSILGFRIATIPEPTTDTLLSLVVMGSGMRRLSRPLSLCIQGGTIGSPEGQPASLTPVAHS